MLTVKQVAGLTGLTVRTLHHYDQIGLLKPAVVERSGYRKYAEEQLGVLEQILFFRELDFPLEEIRQIMSAPGYDSTDALQKQQELLRMKRDRIDKLISLIDNTLKGEKDMSFESFDMSQIEEIKQKYAEEVKEKYGTSDAYKESEQKTAAYTKSDWQRITARQEELYTALATHIGANPGDPQVQQLVHQCREHITKNFYNCTLDIFEGLGQMYVADERFTQNIDRYGKGLAELLSKAIAVYVEEQRK